MGQWQDTWRFQPYSVTTFPFQFCWNRGLVLWLEYGHFLSWRQSCQFTCRITIIRFSLHVLVVKNCSCWISMAYARWMCVQGYCVQIPIPHWSQKKANSRLLQWGPISDIKVSGISCSAKIDLRWLITRAGCDRVQFSQYRVLVVIVSQKRYWAPW